MSTSRGFFLGALATVILASLGPPAQLAIGRTLVNRVVEGSARRELVAVVAVLVGVVVVQRLAGLAQSSLVTLARDNAAAAAVDRYLAAAARVEARHLNDPTFLDRMRHAGDVAAGPFGDMVFGLVSMVGSVTGLLGLATVLATISPPVALLVVLSMVPWVIAQRRGFSHVRVTRLALLPRRREQAYLRGLVTDHDAALELLASGAGIEVVNRHRAITQAILRTERPAHVRQFATIAAGHAAGAVLLVAAFVMAVGAQSGAGDMAALVAALAVFMGFTANLANSISGFMRHGPDLRDYFAFIDTPPAPGGGGGPSERRCGGVAFEHVTFTYPGGDIPAVNDVSFAVEPGELLALVGPNGAGKSTIVKLLLRFYEPDGGGITVGGVDLRECSPHEIRDRIGVVFQDSARYQMTVREVVRMGRPDGDADDDERVWRALEDAGLDGFVRRLGGLDSRVGRLFPGGHDLSGGQWQRFALARLFYRDADVLVLDEPTSSLDAEGEAATFARLRERLGDRIGIVISHRPSTVRAADRIFTLAPWTETSCAPSRSR